jgi:pyruvate kinase
MCQNYFWPLIDSALSSWRIFEALRYAYILACDAALAGDFGKPGDNIVIVAGIPFGASGTTNLLRIAGLPKASL